MSWLCTFGLFQQLHFPRLQFIYVQGGGGGGCGYHGNHSCWDFGWLGGEGKGRAGTDPDIVCIPHRECGGCTQSTGALYELGEGLVQCLLSSLSAGGGL